MKGEMKRKGNLNEMNSTSVSCTAAPRQRWTCIARLWCGNQTAVGTGLEENQHSVGHAIIPADC